MDSVFGAGNNNAPPWASVFDPTANARALSAIQSEGFRAASDLVDRCVQLAANSLGGLNTAGTKSDPQTYDHRTDILGATNIEPLIRGWWSMVGQYLLGSSVSDAVARVKESGTPTQGAALDFANAQANGGLRAEVPVSGATVAELWLHNGSADDFGEIRLRCSDLMADDGAVIAGGAVTFSPEAVPVPGRSSRGIDIEIKVGDDAHPGLYRGNILAEGHPHLWLPVVVTVRPVAP